MKTTGLIILDGMGYNSKIEGNAVALANTPFLDSLFKRYPNTLIEASGLHVGLPEGLMGNSEVGHLNLGSGRVIYQDATRIDMSIKDGDFFTNTVFLKAMKNCIKHNSALHIVGLTSTGGVHSKIEHLFALIKMAVRNNVKKLYIHALTDGRDVPPKSATIFIKQIQKELSKFGMGEIATIVGRYYYMDRDNRWDRLEKGYNAVINGIGLKTKNLIKSIEEMYKNNITDEFIEPIIAEDYVGVMDNDSIIFFNYRADRAREITRAIIEEDFDKFKREGGKKQVYYVCMTEYDKNIKNVKVAFAAKNIKNTFGEYLEKKGLTQLRIAETEKYAHVTFFFNGGVEELRRGEKRVLIPSPKVATYESVPSMSADEIAEKAVGELQKGINVMILNFANCDMLGHTGNIEATIKGVEAVDRNLKIVVDKLLEIGGRCIITADHGNAEQMLYKDNSVCTSHTTNPVPLILVDEDFKHVKLKKSGKLADVVPTLLEMMSLEKPIEMNGESLIVKE